MQNISFQIGNERITMPTIDFEAGQLVRLSHIESNSIYSGHYDVTVYFLSENNQFVPGTLAPNTIGLVISKDHSLKGVYKVLFNDRVAIISDSYLKLFDPNERIINHYENDEGYLPEMETAE